MDNNYKQLMAAIVVRAVKDYSKILRKSRLSNLDKAKKLELEQFFKSEWGELLSELSGEFCIISIHAPAKGATANLYKILLFLQHILYKLHVIFL